ncbi:MAG: 4-(cytidine 5'-diphospho)-2-C-methyl-D-erythritol kinase [Defluviitaleaceae bacterium]|nr:4-(cytidine 5'-diphospho)-2-C-methyl-D-erythritol kinase [Defluviitaleaceae bacterium]
MDFINVQAYAKINLTLDITGTLPNGYHGLRTVMQSIKLHDDVLIKKVDKYKFKMDCDHPKLPVDERNLVHKAANYMIEKFSLQCGVFIGLKKTIPISAGLAGGSSDCAAVLCGMNTLFNLNLTTEELADIGTLFGADVPFCVNGGMTLAEGIGEVLSPLAPLPASWVLLARPSVSVSTKNAFTQYDSIPNVKPTDYTGFFLRSLHENDIKKAALCFGNALTQVTAASHPEIYGLIEIMKQQGAYGASMSGSGPTVFGYFPGSIAAHAAKRAISKAMPMIRSLYVTKTVQTQAMQKN